MVAGQPAGPRGAGQGLDRRGRGSGHRRGRHGQHQPGRVHPDGQAAAGGGRVHPGRADPAGQRLLRALPVRDIARAQRGFNLLTTLGNWLPFVALFLLGLGVYVARDHRRALIGAGLGVAAAMLLLALALAVFRSVYLDAVPADVLPHDAAAVLYDTILRFLRAGLRTVFVLGLVVAAGAFLTGQSVTATRTRKGVAGAIGWLRRGAEGAGLRTGPVGTWVHANRRALRIVAVTLAGLALVFWDRPTGKVVIGLALALLIALAAIEFLARPGQQVPEGSITPQA